MIIRLWLPSFRRLTLYVDIREQDEGYKSVERKIIVDHDWSPFRDNNVEHLVREDITEVTYFWKRVPNTPFTVLVSVPGAPVEGRKMYTPNFRSPEACSQPMSMANVSSIRAASDTCWISTYKDFPLVYHRLDVLSQSTSLPTRLTEPFGGASVCFSEHCSYDTSTWLAAPSSFVSDKQYLELPHTMDRIESISKSMLSGPVAAPENMLGGGLRSRALSSLKITSVMEAFWKDVLGVEGAEMNGNPATLNPAKSDVRRDVLQFVFATDAGILRMYPGGRASVPVDYNVRREPYYTRAISHPGDMAVSQPYLPDALNTTFWTVTLSKVCQICLLMGAMGKCFNSSTSASCAAWRNRLSFYNLCLNLLPVHKSANKCMKTGKSSCTLMLVGAHRQSIIRRRKIPSRSRSMCSALQGCTIDSTLL